MYKISQDYNGNRTLCNGQVVVVVVALNDVIPLITIGGIVDSEGQQLLLLF